MTTMPRCSFCTLPSCPTPLQGSGTYKLPPTGGALSGRGGAAEAPTGAKRGLVAGGSWYVVGLGELLRGPGAGGDWGPTSEVNLGPVCGGVWEDTIDRGRAFGEDWFEPAGNDAPGGDRGWGTGIEGAFVVGGLSVALGRFT